MGKVVQVPMHALRIAVSEGFKLNQASSRLETRGGSLPVAAGAVCQCIPYSGSGCSSSQWHKMSYIFTVQLAFPTSVSLTGTSLTLLLCACQCTSITIILVLLLPA
jgi:hypothetical protein